MKAFLISAFSLLLVTAAPAAAAAQEGAREAAAPAADTSDDRSAAEVEAGAEGDPAAGAGTAGDVAEGDVAGETADGEDAEPEDAAEGDEDAETAAEGDDETEAPAEGEGDAEDTAEGDDETEAPEEQDFGDPIVAEGGTFWMPPQASSVAGEVDWLFYAITALSIFCFIGITAALVFFCVRYRAREGRHAEPSASHNDAMEITWTVIPSILVVIIFVLGWQGYMRLAAVPQHGEEIRVVAREGWTWEFNYPNGWVDPRLHVPVNTPVRLVMRSDDVIHSLFVPAFRVKMDVLPNRYTRMWFEATEPGTYRLYCAEYCGDRHANMKTEVVVHPPGGYEAYLEEAEQRMRDRPLDELGEILVTERLGCQQCHSTDGTDGEGPTLQGIWGQEHELADGTTITVDENHIRKALLDPQARVRAGYEARMPTFAGRVDDREIDAIIEFIKSLE